MGGSHDNCSMDYDDNDDGHHHRVHRLFFLESVEDAAQVGERWPVNAVELKVLNTAAKNKNPVSRNRDGIFALFLSQKPWGCSNGVEIPR